MVKRTKIRIMELEKAEKIQTLLNRRNVLSNELQWDNLVWESFKKHKADDVPVRDAWTYYELEGRSGFSKYDMYNLLKGLCLFFSWEDIKTTVESILKEKEDQINEINRLIEEL